MTGCLAVTCRPISGAPDHEGLAIVSVSIAALAGALVLMVVELVVSRANEHRLFGQGAVAPPDEAYSTMRWAYPGAFVAMAAEGVVMDAAPGPAMWIGVALFAAAKVLKTWAIASLGHRWTYRVLVLRGAPLVTHGPYRHMKHPNYVGVAGELIGMALITGARVTGPLATAFFVWLLRRRIAAEERALGMREPARSR